MGRELKQERGEIKQHIFHSAYFSFSTGVHILHICYVSVTAYFSFSTGVLTAHCELKLFPLGPVFNNLALQREGEIFPYC